MSLRIIVIIEGRHKFLDLYEDEPINMNYSFAEVQDITKKNSGYSQSFKLPGTKNNNQIFNYYYNLNQIPTTFNPNQKYETIITWDGYEIMRGNIRLDSVLVDEDEIIYETTFYNQVGDLSANIGDKFLFETDLSHLSHPWSDEVINYSLLDPNLFPLTGATNYSYQNGKTFWGLYNIGYEYISGNSVNYQVSPLVYFTPYDNGVYSPRVGNFDFSGTPVHDYYFKPTIQIKELYESICRQAGYEIESEFFNTSYYEKFCMPLKFGDETIYSKNSQPVCFSYTGSPFTLLAPATTAYTNPSVGQLCNSLNFSSSTTSFFVPPKYKGLYTFRFQYEIVPTGQCIMTATNLSCFAPFAFDYIDNNGVTRTFTIPYPQCGIPYTIQGCCPSNFLGIGSITYQSQGGTKFVFSGTPNQTVELRTDFACNGVINPVDFQQSFNITGDSELSFYFIGRDCTIQNFKFEIVDGPRFLLSGQTIDYALEFPPNDYKQIDFITSVNRYFNLVVLPSPDKPKTLIVEPMVNYIGKGRTLDWTTKIDHSQPVKVTPTTSLINGTLEFLFQLDQDYANQNYKAATNRVFGTEKVNLNLPFKDQTTRFDYIFSSPIDITIYSAYESMLTLSSFSKINTTDVEGRSVQTFLPFKILPRITFRGLTLPVDNYGNVLGSASTPYQYWYMTSVDKDFTEDRFLEINRFTTYPFNYNDFSHYCNFRGEDIPTITPSEFIFIAQDLYDIYYKPYIDDLISPENKIYTAKIYLYPDDVKQLRFDEKILVDNNYYRINKITNWNALEPAICDIELIKLTKEYEPHRKLYYRLDPCTAPGDTLYSSSDLNYNLYAYIGNYVKVYDDNLNFIDCYQVFEEQYDPTHDYKHYYFSNGYFPELVHVFPDCGCTGRTEFDLVQNVPETPTPTPSNTPNRPTPTTTPTPTPTPSVRDFYGYAGTASVFGTSADACFSPTCARTYFRNAPFWAVGQVVYNDSTLLSPFNGGGNWIAIRSGSTFCTGTWLAVQVDTNGVILSIVTC